MFFEGETRPDSRTREPIEWSALTSSGLIEIISDPTEEEAALYFDLSLELGDGEAMTGAVAYHRGYGVVSDDIKATRLLGEMGIVITSSLEVVANLGRAIRYTTGESPGRRDGHPHSCPVRATSYPSLLRVVGLCTKREWLISTDPVPWRSKDGVIERCGWPLPDGARGRTIQISSD